MRVILQRTSTFCRELVFVKGMFWATDFEATHCDLPNYCGPYGVLLQTPPAGELFYMASLNLGFNVSN